MNWRDIIYFLVSQFDTKKTLINESQQHNASEFNSNHRTSAVHDPQNVGRHKRLPALCEFISIAAPIEQSEASNIRQRIDI